MVVPASNLILIHDAIVPAIASVLPALGATRVQFVQDVSTPIPAATETIARVIFTPPRRQTLAVDSNPTIVQVGRIEVEWLFPIEARWNAILAATSGTAEALRERTLPGVPTGIRMHGGAITDRGDDQQGRTVYRVSAEWETVQEEPAAGELRAQLTPVTDAEAFRGVRDIWEQRIQNASVSEGWAGLFTQWDQMPTVVPAIPWCAWFAAGIAAEAMEIGASNEFVAARALVQMHTNPLAGAVPTLAMLERILAEHNCTTRQVRIGPASIDGQRLSPAATLQTNIRIPFVYERTKP